MASRPECFGEYDRHTAKHCIACPLIASCREQTDTRQVVRKTVDRVKEAARNGVLDNVQVNPSEDTRQVAEVFQATLKRAALKAENKIEGTG